MKIFLMNRAIKLPGIESLGIESALLTNGVVFCPNNHVFIEKDRTNLTLIKNGNQIKLKHYPSASEISQFCFNIQTVIDGKKYCSIPIYYIWNNRGILIDFFKISVTSILDESFTFIKTKSPGKMKYFVDPSPYEMYCVGQITDKELLHVGLEVKLTEKELFNEECFM